MVSVGSRLEEGRSPEIRKHATVATKQLILTRGSLMKSEKSSARLSRPNVKNVTGLVILQKTVLKEKVVPKKEKVSVLTAEEKEAEAALPPAAELSAVSEAPAAALNSVSSK